MMRVTKEKLERWCKWKQVKWYKIKRWERGGREKGGKETNTGRREDRGDDSEEREMGEHRSTGKKKKKKKNMETA